MTPSLILGGRGIRSHWAAHLGTWLRQKKVSWDEGSRTEAASRRQQRTSFSDWLRSKTAIWRVCGPWAARSTDLEQPIRDWQNICIIATENDLIDLTGDFEYTMYDLLVEQRLQRSDADSSLQTVEQNILDKPIAEETKRRLLSTPLLKAYQPISGPWDPKKVETPNPLWGWKDLTLFIRCIMNNPNQRMRSGLTFWKDVRMIHHHAVMKSWL